MPGYTTLDISDPDENVPAEVAGAYGGIHSAYTWYNNPEALRLTKQAELTIDPAGRAKIYAELQRSIAEQSPIIPLYYAPFVYARQSTVSGFTVPPTGGYHLEDVSV